MEIKISRKEFISNEKLKKEYITRKYDTSELTDRYGLNCSIDAMISFCNKAKKDLEDKKEVVFVLDCSYDEYSIELEYKDLETDEEFEDRVDDLYIDYCNEVDNRNQAEINKRFKKELASLKMKYGKS